MRAFLARHPIVTLAAATVLLYGCASPKDSSHTQISTRPDSMPPVANPSVGHVSPDLVAQQGNEGVSTLVDARPAALVNGQAINWGDLRPTLNELAGGEALQEVILDRRIDESLRSAGITISDDDIAAERKLLLESLDNDPNQAIRLLDELRNRQKLGKVRFDALMRRNASLRALVRDKVKITDDAIRNMHELLHGPKRQARIMILPSLEQAQAAINLVNSGASFADVAVEMSTDSSAPRGGLLEPISRVDPNYPESIRQTLWTLNPGEMSGPVLIDDRYAVVMAVKRVAGDGIKLEDAIKGGSLERLVRIQQERLLMDQLARKLVADTQVTVFDDSLQESWTRLRREKP